MKIQLMVWTNIRIVLFRRNKQKRNNPFIENVLQLFIHRKINVKNGIIKISTKFLSHFQYPIWRARRLSGRVSDSGARGLGFEPHDRRVVSLSKTL